MKKLSYYFESQTHQNSY